MEIPSRFKPVTQYVRRAEKLDRAPEPEAAIVAYHCRLYAIDQAIKLQDKSDERYVNVFCCTSRLLSGSPMSPRCFRLLCVLILHTI